MRLWQCCGADGNTGSINCDSPTDERFDAPGPRFIKTYWPRQKAKNAKNTGAIVGGVVAAVVILLALVITVLLLRRRRHTKQERDKSASAQENQFSVGYPAKIWKPSPVELQDSNLPIEMNGRNQQEAAELPGTIPHRGEMADVPER